MIKGAVFDVDGILVDTEGLQWKGWINVLKPLGVELTKKKYFDYAGKGVDIVAPEIKKDFNLNVSINFLVKGKEKAIMELFQGELKIVPGAREAVEFFAKKGVKLASAGGAEMKENVFKLKKVGLLHFFSVIVSGVDDVKREKPYPDVYLLAVKKLGLKPEECIAFEDTEYGVRAAKSAGLVCLALPNEFSVKQDFSMADGVFKNFKEALEWVKKKYEL